MKIMILHKNDAWHGGVVNFVRMLKKPPHDTTFVSEYIGPRSADEHKTISAARPLADAVSVAFKLRHSDNDLLFVNPSLNKASFLRDGLICMVCKWITRKPQVIFFHGWSDNFCTRIQRNRFYKFWFNHSFAKANLIFVLAKRFKSDLQRLGVDPDRIIFTPTMFDEDDIRSNKSEASEPRIRLLFMSRLVREKGLFETLTAFEAYLAKTGREDVSLYIAGDGPAMGELQTRLQSSPVSNKVHVLGYVSGQQKADLLHSCHVFVFPTYYPEGCPVSLLEAMASGLAIITGSTGGIPDIFVPENGIMLSEVSSNSVTTALNALLTDNAQLNQIREFNRGYANKHFERKVITDRIITLCQSAGEKE